MATEAQVADTLLQHRQRLWRLIHFRMPDVLRGRVDAEDILQETYLSAIQRREHFPEDGTEYLWLRLLALQTLSDVQRRHVGAQKRSVLRESQRAAAHANQTTSLSIVGQLLGHLTSPSQALIREELGKSLRDAIEQMGELDSEILALRHFEEMSNQEVAKVLDITEKTASIRYVRAIKRLKDLLPKIPQFPADLGNSPREQERS